MLLYLMRLKRCKTYSCKIVLLRGDATCLAARQLQEIDPSQEVQSLVQTQGNGVGVREYVLSFLIQPRFLRARTQVTTSKTKIKGKKGTSCSCSLTECLEHAISGSTV